MVLETLPFPFGKAQAFFTMVQIGYLEGEPETYVLPLTVARGDDMSRVQSEFKNAVVAMQNAAEEALRRCNLTVADIKCIIPHQANLRIIQATADRLGAPMDKVYVNLNRYGNVSAGSVAIALDEAAREGRFQRGDLILLVVFGGGLTWASCVIQW